MKKFLSQKDMAEAKRDESLRFLDAKKSKRVMHGVDQSLSRPGDIVTFTRESYKGAFDFKKQPKRPTKRKIATKVCVHFSGKAF